MKTKKEALDIRQQGMTTLKKSQAGCVDANEDDSNVESEDEKCKRK